MTAPFSDLVADLNARIAQLAIHLKGQPTQRTATAMRWGSKGSFVLQLVGARAGKWHCFESDKGGDGFDLIEHEMWLEKREAIAWARNWLGLPAPDPAPVLRPRLVAGPIEDDVRAVQARRLWDAAGEPRGTLVERYLQGRGLDLDDDVAGWVIRFHGAMPWRFDDGEVRPVPGMVVAMRDIRTDELRAVRRTPLTGDGKKLAPPKMLGPAKGCVVKLDPDEAVAMGLGLAEGVETALAVRQRGWRPVWAAGSAGSISSFPLLSGIEALTLFADRDDPGIEAACTCATRWREAGCDTRIIAPRTVGADWNDEGRNVGRT